MSPARPPAPFDGAPVDPATSIYFSQQAWQPTSLDGHLMGTAAGGTLPRLFGAMRAVQVASEPAA